MIYKIIFFLLHTILIAQNQYVRVDSSKFMLNGEQFRFLGANATYLYQQVSYNRHFIVDDVFSNLRAMKVKVVRISAHYESDNRSDPAVIMYGPNLYNEYALRCLDYVLMKAKQFDLKLILILTNNWKHYGGIPKYIEWANRRLKPLINFTHNDFFKNDSIKSWYKNYLYMLLNRINTYTLIKYKDDPTIFSWELINEPRSTDKSGLLIYNWLKEMSFYVRSLDSNHLIGTGEEGMDISPNFYPSYEYFYNNRKDLFDGTYGISFQLNTSIENIDYASIHLYPEAWGFSEDAGINWIRDHIRISKIYNKPLLLGEFGSKDKNINLINRWLNIIKKSLISEAIFWQYLHPLLPNNDGFGINLQNNFELCNLFKNYIDSLKFYTFNEESIVKEELKQNYPNPFNNTTNLEIILPSDGKARLFISDILGQTKLIITEGFLDKGKHHFVISVKNEDFSSGVYFYTLEFNGRVQSKKMIYIK